MTLDEVEAGTGYLRPRGDMVQAHANGPRFRQHMVAKGAWVDERVGGCGHYHDGARVKRAVVVVDVAVVAGVVVAAGVVAELVVGVAVVEGVVVVVGVAVLAGVVGVAAGGSSGGGSQWHPGCRR